MIIIRLVLVCYRNYRYPGCTTRTSVPSQPTALQKPSYKKNRIYKIKKPPPPPPPNPTPSVLQKKPPYKKETLLRKLVMSNKIKKMKVKNESKIKKNIQYYLHSK